jgi:hypothetical protein
MLDVLRELNKDPARGGIKRQGLRAELGPSCAGPYMPGRHVGFILNAVGSLGGS